MIIINGFVSDEIKQQLLDDGTHPTARRHGNLIIAGGDHSDTRVVKFIVTGNESFEFASDNHVAYFSKSDINEVSVKNIEGASCTHFTKGDGSTLASIKDREFIFNAISTGVTNGFVSFRNNSVFTSKTATAEWFKQQYANGTPVTVVAYIKG